MTYIIHAEHSLVLFTERIFRLSKNLKDQLKMRNILNQYKSKIKLMEKNPRGELFGEKNKDYNRKIATRRFILSPPPVLEFLRSQMAIRSL